MHIVRQVLSLGIVVVLMLVPATSAQDGSEGFDVAWMEEQDAIEIDGQLDEAPWQSAAHQQISLSGVGDEDGERFAQMYIAHNGSALFLALAAEGAQRVTIQFDAGGGREAGFARDAIQVDQDGTVTDLQWDQDQEEWVTDDSAEDCGSNGTAATSNDAASGIYEIEKPFAGDTCDAFLTARNAIGLRVLVEADGQEFAWPAGSGDTEGADWGRMTLQDRFEDTDQEVGPGPDEGPRDPRLETGPEQGVDPNAPPAPGVDSEGPAYNAESERETPNLGWALLIVSALAGLAVVAHLRRTG